MEIAGQRRTNLRFSVLNGATGQLLSIGLLLSIAYSTSAIGQQVSRPSLIAQALLEYDNGNYTRALELASAVDAASRNKSNVAALDIIAASQIALEQLDDAEVTLKRSLALLPTTTSETGLRSQTYFRLSDIFRARRNFPEALRHSKFALEASPNNRETQAKYFLSIGRIMFSAGYDLSAIVWLEKAEQIFRQRPVSSGQLDTYRFLSLAWSAKLNYPKALEYSEKFSSSTKNSRYKQKYRQSLFEAAALLSSTGQKRKALATLETGLKLSLEHNSSYQARNFLASLLLNSLYDSDIPKATAYLRDLKNLDTNRLFSFETNLGEAIIAAFNGHSETSEKLFKDLERMNNTSDFILPSWKITIAEKHNRWDEVIRLNEGLLALTLANNFRDDLPGIYLSFAKAHFHLKQPNKSVEFLEKSLSLIEEIRSSDNKNLSLGLQETYHNAYRLLTQIRIDRSFAAFESSDYLKARVLKDKINGPVTATRSSISPDVRRKLEDLSLKMLTDTSAAAEISRYENAITVAVRSLIMTQPDLSALDKLADLDDKAVVSYMFTLDNRLLAFVWEMGRPVRSIYLPDSEESIVSEVTRAEQKIKNLVFFKRDGKDLHDKLLKPLGVSAKHLIIVPDKQLWKVPFQALSPDGERYLIESKAISYAPSVAILLEHLKNPKPVRHTLQVFANPSFGGQYLQFVNSEATTIASLFKSRPILNATVGDFRRLSDKADILHFSMHAQIDNDRPLNSFLSFAEMSSNSGRFTVEDLSNIKLKKGSLVFLASCDTNKVLSGEGVVSLAWGMMGAGATTVISTQWEADDRLTKFFTTKFYGYYKRGFSSAEALQKASLDLIRDKSGNMHEPYYWADFTVNGDFR